jgi:hypothetical protein
MVKYFNGLKDGMEGIEGMERKKGRMVRWI